MSNTRFRNDPARIRKEMEISTYSGRYFLDTPGQGINMPFMEDVHVRLQAWGANYDADHFLEIENDLRGSSHKLTRDDTYPSLQYRSSNAYKTYPVMEPFVKESRASHPAWILRDQDAHYLRWEQPWLDPQSHTERCANCHINTKRQAKESFVSLSEKRPSQDELHSHLESFLPTTHVSQKS